MRNGEAISLDQVAAHDLPGFRRFVLDGVGAGGRVIAFFGIPEERGLRLYALLLRPPEISVASTVLEKSYPALTPECPALHWFEREIAELHGVIPEGHPWLKPIRFTRPGSEPAVAPMFRVEGDEVHEVAVGPVHAGVIEPGHFRFQCHGERVFHLEISLGYQHRGVERALRGGPDKRSIHYAETLAGDTSVGHATAYSEIAESLGGIAAPPRATAVRAIALELERLANHTGDLGALAGDVGYLPTAAYCGRLRGDFLNLTASLCGSRFGRGLVRPGGVGFDLDARRAGEMREKLGRALVDVRGAVRLLWRSVSVRARFDKTGALSRETAAEIGLVGPAARACGLGRDVRRDAPSGAWKKLPVPLSRWRGGDVLARAYVRWREIRRSVALVEKLLASLPTGPIRSSVPSRLAARRLAVSLVEGWRGEICHVAVTGEDGRFEAYKVVDPSFHNWFGLALALRDQQISDFPLCNKSFNLSYCGHDL